MTETLSENESLAQNKSDELLRTYFLFRSAADEFFLAVREHKITSPKRLRRSFLDLVDWAQHSPHDLFALTVILDDAEGECGGRIVSEAVATSLLALVVAQQLNLSYRDQFQIGLTGLFYNIGFLGPDSSNILKNTRLTAAEYKKVLDAQASGVYHLLRMQGTSRPVLERVLSIFEYAKGSSMKSISLSLESRLLRLVSQYVALTNERPFRDAYTPVEAIKILGSKASAGVGSELDPILYFIFVRFLGFYPLGSLCLMSNGRKAVVYRPHGVTPGVPVIKWAAESGDPIDLSEHKDVRILKVLDPRREGLQISGYLFE